jgi:hypothetical protein
MAIEFSFGAPVSFARAGKLECYHTPQAIAALGDSPGQRTAGCRRERKPNIRKMGGLAEELLDGRMGLGSKSEPPQPPGQRRQR